MYTKDKRIGKTSLPTNRFIRVVGAREHNLKNIEVIIPKDTLTVITGPSGSGKSSLALDILFAEGKRRYMESLSAYARQFLGIAKKPDVDRVEGLCPSIAIDQKTVGSNPRSTVGTITEIYDYLRVLFARIGVVHCPSCKTAIKPQSPDKITQLVTHQFINTEITIAAPIARAKKGEFTQELNELIKNGYYRFIIDDVRYTLKTIEDIKKLKLQKTYKHTIDVLIDFLTVNNSEKARVHEGIEKAFALAQGMAKIFANNTEYIYSSKRMCITCGFSCDEIEPRTFSFNSPIGACSTCHGLGVVYQWGWRETVATLAPEQEHNDKLAAAERICSACAGKRLNNLALAVTVGRLNIHELSSLSIEALGNYLANLSLGEQELAIASSLLREICNRVQFLQDVGLGYLSLNRTARTLSGGEGQRIRLATQIGSALSGVLYILDEPSIGLHQKDNDRLIKTLHTLRDQGNTVVVVEHDLDTIAQADYIIDMGPAAGVHGGRIVAAGTPQEIAKNPASLTGHYLSGKKNIERLKPIRPVKEYITLENAQAHNLKNISVKFPLKVLCGVSGVSGSGKSTLIMEELVPRLQKTFAQRLIEKKKRVSSLFMRFIREEEAPLLTGADLLENMVVIDQTPIGRTPRSNPATYLGIFDDVRALFAALPESKARGYKSGRFSFNVTEGRCSECSGEGTITVSMHFLPDVTTVCPLCKGMRYNAQTLEIVFKDKNIAQVLDMTALEACEFFSAHAPIYKRLKLLCDVGLDYIQLGQPATTLSGGEAQRIKLVHELAKRGNNTLYILDEPTTGLHSNDIVKLLQVLNKLVDKGNSMIIIEHNLDVLKTVDYLIDLGPEGGDKGGTIVAQGTPKQVAQCPASYTGQYLKRLC